MNYINLRSKANQVDSLVYCTTPLAKTKWNE